MKRRKRLTAAEIQSLANKIGRERGNSYGQYGVLRASPIPFAAGDRIELGANWTVLSLGCPPECADFWRGVLQEVAREYDLMC